MSDPNPNLNLNPFLGKNKAVGFYWQGKQQKINPLVAVIGSEIVSQRQFALEQLIAKGLKDEYVINGQLSPKVTAAASVIAAKALEKNKAGPSYGNRVWNLSTFFKKGILGNKVLVNNHYELQLIQFDHAMYNIIDTPSNQSEAAQIQFMLDQLSVAGTRLTDLYDYLSKSRSQTWFNKDQAPALKKIAEAKVRLSDMKKKLKEEMKKLGELDPQQEMLNKAIKKAVKIANSGPSSKPPAPIPPPRPDKF